MATCIFQYVYVFFKTHQLGHLKLVNITVWKLCLNKVYFFKNKKKRLATVVTDEKGRMIILHIYLYCSLSLELQKYSNKDHIFKYRLIVFIYLKQTNTNNYKLFPEIMPKTC